MLYLSQTQSNTKLVTTTRQNRIVIATNSYYTWVITNRGDLESFNCAPDDNSDSPYYSTWSMSYTPPTGGPYPRTGYVEFPFEQGEWHYTIYQTEAQYDWLLTGTVYGIVEEGLLFVTGTSSPILTYSASSPYTGANGFNVFTEY